MSEKYRHILLLLLVSVSFYCHGSSPYLDAILTHNYDAIQALIDEGIPLNTQDSPLLEALEYGDLKTVLIMLKGGANPNFVVMEANNNVDNIMKFAPDHEKLVAMLSYGGTPFKPNGEPGWEFFQAIADRRYLHSVVYQYWDFSQPPPKPSTMEELAEILKTLPMLQVKSLITILENDLDISVLPPKLQKIIENCKP